MTQIEQECWVEGCNHNYDCDDLQRLTRAVFMHLKADHGNVDRELLIK